MAHSFTRRSRAAAAAVAVSCLTLTLAGSTVAQDASPAGSPSGTGPLFVNINKSADQQYFIDQATAFQAAIEEMGGTALTSDAKLDPDLGINLVNDAISAGAKGIAITVPDQTIGPAVAKAARDAGVALVATNDNIVDDTGAPVPMVGFNGTDMGTKVGEAAAKLLTESGWLDDPSKKVGVLSTEVQTLSVCEDRTNASKEKVIAAGVPAENVFQVPYTGVTQSAQDAAGPVITAHPDVTNWVVFACNDEGALGTLNALAAAGASPDNIIGVGLGAYEACKPWAAGTPSGFKAALFISGLDVGKMAAKVLWDNVVNGVPLPPESIAPTTIVDATTYATVMDPISVANCSK